MDCRPPGSSVHGDSPGKKTGVGCLSLLQGNFLTQESNWVSCIASRFFTSWATEEAHFFAKTFYFSIQDCLSLFIEALIYMGIPDHLTCFLRNLYAGQEAEVRTGHGTTNWFQIMKGVHQGCILSPCLFNFYAEYIMRKTLGWRKHKLESRLLGEISITSDMQMTPSLWQKVKKN